MTCVRKYSPEGSGFRRLSRDKAGGFGPLPFFVYAEPSPATREIRIENTTTLSRSSMSTKFYKALDAIHAMEQRLAAVATEILANDKAFESYPRALDAQVFYRLALTSLFNDKQDLLKEQRDLEQKIDVLRDSTLADLDAKHRASLRDPKQQEIARQERERCAAERERVQLIREDEQDRSEWSFITLDNEPNN